MAVKVKEGRDYKLLPDDYRKLFKEKGHPCKVKTELAPVKGELDAQGKPLYRKRQVKYYYCMYCSRLIPDYEMEVDHIIPKTRFHAGQLWNPNKLWNLGPSCKLCNQKKSNYADARIFIGFKNKFMHRFGICKGGLEEFSSADDPMTKVKVGCLIGIVSLATLISPFIWLSAKTAEYTLHYGGRFAWWLTKGAAKTTFKTIKFAFMAPFYGMDVAEKGIKKTRRNIKKVRKLFKRLMQGGILAGIAYVALQAMGFSFMSIGQALRYLANWLGGV